MWLKACVNGSRRPGEHPGVPVDPAALARESAAAVGAGARAVHLHARDAEGAESLQALDVAACVTAVRAAVPGVPVGVSTGLWVTAGDADRRAADLEGWGELPAASRPDFASVNLGEEGAASVWHRLGALGIGVEPGIWTPPDLDVLARLRPAVAETSRGSGDAVVRVLLEVLDAPPGQERTRAAALLAAARDAGLDDALLLLHGEGAAAWPVLVLAAAEGLQGRIGLEDVLEGPLGEPVTGNADLVRAALALASPTGGGS
jgi:uncharacterized protein (DUF849 family)